MSFSEKNDKFPIKMWKNYIFNFFFFRQRDSEIEELRAKYSQLEIRYKEETAQLKRQIDDRESKIAYLNQTIEDLRNALK